MKFEGEITGFGTPKKYRSIAHGDIDFTAEECELAGKGWLNAFGNLAGEYMDFFEMPPAFGGEVWTPTKRRVWRGGRVEILAADQ